MDRGLRRCPTLAFFLWFTSTAAAEPPFIPPIEQALHSMVRDYATFVDDVGISLYVTDGSRSFSGFAGLANRREQAFVRQDTQFRVGSHTKTVVAVIAMQLVDEGQLSLSDSFGKYFPQYSRFADVSLGELLGMRSGISEYLRSPWGLWSFATAPKQPRKIDELLSFIRDENLEFVPGSACRYSNSNYLAVGMILEKITGKSVAQLIEERIVIPLGLHSTFLDEGTREVPNLAHGYLDVYLAAAIWNMPPIFYYAFNRLEQMGDGVVDSTNHLHPSAGGPTGALISTPNDMTKIMRALIEGRLVSSQALANMMEVSDCILADKHVEYGMGLFRWDSPQGLMYGHGGITFGFRTGTFHHMERGITFSLMANQYPDQLEPFVDEMLRVLAQKTSPPTDFCNIPDDYFDNATDDILNVGFRGEITSEADERPTSFGMIRIRRHGRLYQLHTAELAVRRNEDGSLIVTGTGSRQGGSNGLLRATLIIRPAAATNASQPQAIALLEDLDISPENGRITKACVSSVGNFSQAKAGLHLCDPEVLERAQYGDIFRFFARMPMTSNPRLVAEELKKLERPMACYCYNEEGKSTPCN